MNRRKFLLALKISAFVLCISLFFPAIGANAAQHVRRSVATAHKTKPATAQEKQLGEKNCLDGIPTEASSITPQLQIIYRQGYVLGYSPNDRIPMWVCESVTTAQLTGHLTRENDQFKVDPEVVGVHATPQDYLKTGYDRGHQAPAGNQTVDSTLKQETFYMSNMAPQIPTLNRGIWKALEEKTRDWVKQYGQAYEWTGPIFYDPKEDDSATADGTVKYKTIGADDVAVPTDFYKIIVVKEGAKYKSIAFVMHNGAYTTPYDISKHRQSIAWIEQHTGLMFMPDLPVAQRKDLENTVSEMWP